MYSASKLNKQGDNIQPWHTPFLIWNQSVVPCPVLLLLPDLHTGFSRGRSGGLVFLSREEFSTVCCDPHSQRLELVNKAEIDVFFGTVLLFPWSSGCWQFDLCSSAFSKTNLNISKFTVHILLKPGLENFEHYFTSVWDECKCAVVWVFFGIAFLWDWNVNWPFPVLWPLLSFPNLLAYWVQHFHSIIFQVMIAQLEFHHLH